MNYLFLVANTVINNNENMNNLQSSIYTDQYGHAYNHLAELKTKQANNIYFIYGI